MTFININLNGNLVDNMDSTELEDRKTYYQNRIKKEKNRNEVGMIANGILGTTLCVLLPCHLWLYSKIPTFSSGAKSISLLSIILHLSAISNSFEKAR